MDSNLYINLYASTTGRDPEEDPVSVDSVEHAHTLGLQEYAAKPYRHYLGVLDVDVSRDLWEGNKIRQNSIDYIDDWLSPHGPWDVVIHTAIQRFAGFPTIPIHQPFAMMHFYYDGHRGETARAMQTSERAERTVMLPGLFLDFVRRVPLDVSDAKHFNPYLVYATELWDHAAACIQLEGWDLEDINQWLASIPHQN